MKTVLVILLLLVSSCVFYAYAVPTNNGSQQQWTEENRADDSSGGGGGNPLSAFFNSVVGFFQNGFNTLFGDEGSESRGASVNRVSYRKYRLFRAVPRTNDQLLEMKGMEDDLEGVKFWKAPMRNQSADFQVPPGMVTSVKDFLHERQIQYEIISEDLQRMIARQNPKMTKERRDELKGQIGHTMTWRRYHRYTDILVYLEYLKTSYPDLVSVIKIGQSSKGLPLRVVKISSGKAEGGKDKPAIWVDGGTHAREWISPAVVTYMLKQLVENKKVNQQVVDSLDWYILPVANPDGYEYSHTRDRLWRKTRSDTDDDSGRSRIARIFFGSCQGVDPNRNWDFHWGEKGASDDPCDETYAGAKAFSEPETRAISEFIMARKEQVKVFLTLHSYGQMWLMPWGYTKARVDDYDDMMSMGRKAVDALAKVDGTKYDLGAATALLYHSAGGADDWAKGKAGIKYSYTVELRDTGTFGFLLPASQIIPTGKETFAAVKAMARNLIAKERNTLTLARRPGTKVKPGPVKVTTGSNKNGTTTPRPIKVKPTVSSSTSRPVKVKVTTAKINGTARPRTSRLPRVMHPSATD